jgi:Methylamine utilisation protein MauE
VTEALTSPFLLAALVLCIAGVAKLRAPTAASRAAAILGLPSSPVAVRSLAGVELVIGGWALVAPSAVLSGAVAALYLLFAVLSTLLARRRASCGCFGESDAPASKVQALLSAILAAISGVAALVVPHGLIWVIARSAPTSVALVLGTAGAAFGTVLLYSDLPQAWSSWSGR